MTLFYEWKELCADNKCEECTISACVKTPTTDLLCRPFGYAAQQCVVNYSKLNQMKLPDRLIVLIWFVGSGYDVAICKKMYKRAQKLLKMSKTEIDTMLCGRHILEWALVDGAAQNLTLTQKSVKMTITDTELVSTSLISLPVKKAIWKLFSLAKNPTVVSLMMMRKKKVVLHAGAIDLGHIEDKQGQFSL